MYSRNRRAVGARVANNHGRQRSGTERTIETDVRLGRSDSNQFSGTGDDGGKLNTRTRSAGKSTRLPALHHAGYR